MSDCVIISGKLEAKLRNKLFAYFHQRYVELVYVEKQINNTTSSGHYEMRLYKNKNKTQSSLYSFTINPISMTCYINYLNSNKHQFTLSIHKKYTQNKTKQNKINIHKSNITTTALFAHHNKHQSASVHIQNMNVMHGFLS